MNELSQKQIYGKCLNKQSYLIKKIVINRTKF